MRDRRRRRPSKALLQFRKPCSNIIGAAPSRAAFGKERTATRWIARFERCIRGQIRVGTPHWASLRLGKSMTDYTWDIPARRTAQEGLQSIKKLHRAPLSLLRRHLA